MDGQFQEGQQLQPQAEPVGQAEPTSLEEAWARMRGIGGEGAQAPVPAAEEGSQPAQREEPEGDDPAGGSAGVQQPAVGEQPPAVDYTQHIQQLAKGLADKAEHDVREEFEKQGIRHLDVSSFYEREKDPRTGQETGRVVFRNPDYPNGPRISRTECQQIVDTLNAQIDREMSKAVEERKQQYMEDNRSTFRMYEFAPSYSQMEDSAQKIFNILIKDYAVVRNGKTVGWNCDLKQMAQVARNIASSYAPQTQPQAAPEPSKPVVDNPAGSTGTAPQAEPKDLAEAMKMYQQQQKNNRK